MKYKITLESILMTAALLPVGSPVLFTLCLMLLLRLPGIQRAEELLKPCGNEVLSPLMELISSQGMSG